MRTRALPAAQYDALKAAAERRGGVGSGQMFDMKGCGVCGYGLAVEAKVLTPPPVKDLKEKYDCTLSTAALDLWLLKQSDVYALPFTYYESDDAVTAVRRRTPGGPRRVPFDEWAAELGLTRGE